MGRTLVGGALTIARANVRAAANAPFLGLMYVTRWREDVVIRPRSLAKLGLLEDRYDDTRGVWFFKCELHDDDLPNASYEPLWSFLASGTGPAFVASRESWRSRPDWFAYVANGTRVEHQNVDDSALRALVAQQAWAPALDAFDAL